MKVARYQIKGMFFTCFLRHHEIWRSGVFVCTCDRRPLVLRCWHFSRPLAKRCPVSPHCTLHATIFFLFCCMPRKLVIHVVIRPDPESMRHVLFLFNFIFFLFFRSLLCAVSAIPACIPLWYVSVSQEQFIFIHIYLRCRCVALHSSAKTCWNLAFCRLTIPTESKGRLRV